MPTQTFNPCHSRLSGFGALRAIMLMLTLMFVLGLGSSALAQHPVCGEPGLMDCCVAHPAGNPGCNDPACCSAVCGCDPFCCNGNWDSVCAGFGAGGNGCGAAVLCEQCIPEPECGLIGMGDCCTAGESPFCEDAECCTMVCDEDPFCCDDEWDASCAELAGKVCPQCQPECDHPTPENDVCANAPLATLGTGNFSHTFEGSNLCSTIDCNNFGGGDGHVWIAFELLQASDVTLSFCGSVNEQGEPFDNAWLNLSLGCPCSALTQPANPGSCPDGNLTMTWPDVLPGTYYYPVMWEQASGTSGDYVVTVSIPDPVLSCAGNCFDQAPGGCWCTEDCAERPEGCCPNLCSVCNIGCPSDCCVLHLEPGCTDQECEDLVCGMDPYCCNNLWDALCKNSANTYCAVCDGCPECLETGACCDAAIGPECQDTLPEICNVNGGNFEGFGTSCEAGDCPELVCACQSPNLGPGCAENSMCEQCVCDQDPFCCDTNWDGTCVADANFGTIFGGGACADVCCGPLCDADGCPDLDGSGGVDVFDLLELLANWGDCQAVGCDGDVNCDAGVDVFDLLDLLAAWGSC